MTPIDPQKLLSSMFEAAIASVQPAECVPPHLPAPAIGRTIVVGAGKAAAAMARAVEDHFSAPITGVVVTRYGSRMNCEQIQVLEAAHPVADNNSVKSAQAILKTVKGLTPNDLVIALISGGGSALMALPVDGVSLEEKQNLVAKLMHQGAPIDLLNQLRTVLSKVKGGKLAEAISPARCVSLIISDVVGDDLATIASGPTIQCSIAETDLFTALEKYEVDIPNSIKEYLSRTGQNHASVSTIPRHDYRLIATPKMALEHAAIIARNAGLQVVTIGDDIEGTPAKAAFFHLETLRRMASGSVLLSGGELTCSVNGQGKGGPNLEFALELVQQSKINEPFWALAADTDGFDGNSDAAGAFISPNTLKRSEAFGLSASDYLDQSNSFAFFDKLGDVIDTGPTHTNVNDIRILLKL